MAFRRVFVRKTVFDGIPIIVIIEPELIGRAKGGIIAHSNVYYNQIICSA